MQIAEVLDVNPLSFISEASDSAEDIIQTFFWLVGDNPGKANTSEDDAVRYNDSDD